MSQLETNTTSLQTLLDKVNALPEANSGEDVTEETNTYTNLLTELETAIDELPDAGSGGANVETCTVTLSNFAWGFDVYYIYTVINPDGTYSAQRTLVGYQEADSASITVTVPKYSTVIIDAGDIYQYTFTNEETHEGADFLYWVCETDDPNYYGAAVFMVTADVASIEYSS